MSHSSNIDIVGILYIYIPHIFTTYIVFVKVCGNVLLCFGNVFVRYILCKQSFHPGSWRLCQDLAWKVGWRRQGAGRRGLQKQLTICYFVWESILRNICFGNFCLEKDWKHRKFFLSSVTDRPLRNLPATWPASVLALLVLLVLWSIGCIGCIQWTFPTFPGLAFCRPRHETAKLEVDSGKIWQNMTIMTKSSAFSTQKKLEKKKRWVHVFFYLNDRKSPISFHSMPDVRAASRYLHLGA